MSSDFLHNHAYEELHSQWRSFFKSKTDNYAVFVAEKEDVVSGFICVKLHHDPDWGTYIDSLHVGSALRGKGAGKKLLRHAAAWIAARDDKSPVYLWVFEDNQRAASFYINLGGLIVERTESAIPSSYNAPVLRVGWKAASELLDPF
nr:GNAT family N-acetyltransferase [Providencia alcalifaciens]